MSNIARTDEIDKLVSSVRNFVAHKEPNGQNRRVKSELLVLTPALRVDSEDALQTPFTYRPALAEAPSNVLRIDAGKEPERASLEATIAELEAAVTAQPDDWEPDEGEAFAQDAWAASAFHRPVNDSPASAPTQPDIASHIMDEVEAAIDVREITRATLKEMKEHTLREMVVQIIREELAGEMGEKITRNVRKLVRREINRVMASKELD